MSPEGATPEGVDRHKRATLGHRRLWIEGGVATAGYAVLAILLTWPLVLHFGSQIPGGTGLGGDPSGYVWDLWFHARSGLDLWGVSTQELVGAPWGRSSPASVNVTLFLSLGPGWLVTKLAGPIVAYNVLVLGGLVTSSLAMHLLVRWLGLGLTAAVWASAAFMAFPYHVFKAASHIPFVQLAPFPLLILTGIRWLERPGWGRSAWMAGAVGLAWLANPYYGVMAFVIALVFGLIALVRVLRADGIAAAAEMSMQALATMVGIVVLPLAALFLSSRGAVDSNLSRDPIELELYGARVSDYLLPTVDANLWTGIFGVADWGRWGSPGGERTAFVGYVTIALALIGVALVLRSWRSTPERLRITVISGLVLAPVLVLFSLASPYPVFGRAIEMPSSVVFELAPYLRAFGRFSAAVMAVLLVLAAIGLSRLIRGRRTQVGAIAVAAAAFIATAVELPNATPGTLPLNAGVPVQINGQAPEDVPTWAWLRDEAEPDAIVLETAGTPNELVDRYYMFGQTVHGLPITNGSLSGGEIAYRFTQEYGHPGWSGVATRLAAADVDYVTIHPFAYAQVGQPQPDVTAPPPGFEVAEVFPDGSAVWRVVADPADAIAIRWDGWWDPEAVERGPLRWLSQAGSVAVIAPGEGNYEVAFSARGLDPGATYQTILRGPDGTERRVRITGTERVRVPLDLPAGRSDIDIAVATPTARTISPEDLRVVTIQTGPWDVSLRDERTAAAG